MAENRVDYVQVKCKQNLLIWDIKKENFGIFVYEIVCIKDVHSCQMRIRMAVFRATAPDISMKRKGAAKGN